MPMFEGNWKCSGCGGAITQLPFQPRSASGLTCRDCYGKSKDTEQTEQPVPEMQTVSEAPPMDGAPDFDEYGSSASAPMPDDGAFAGLEDPTPVSASSNSGGGTPKHTGNWSCSGCSAPITSLPFVPRGDANLKCLDCFKASKA
jgi:CxxC-x17-CxxC domain-containing protein